MLNQSSYNRGGTMNVFNDDDAELLKDMSFVNIDNLSPYK